MSVNPDIPLGGGYELHEGDRIMAARTRLGLEKQELAARASINRQTLASYERGAKVKESSRRLLALALGVSVEWLETGRLREEDGDGPGDGTKLPRLDSNQKPSDFVGSPRSKRVSWSQPLHIAA